MNRNRVENRAQMIYAHLMLHRNQRFTMPQLCKALGIHDGSTTRTAIRRARGLATEAGYHFPPAVPANGCTYTVTDLPEKALDPSLHMARIETGVRARKENGIEFMRRERNKLPADLRPVVDMHLTIHDAAREALGTIQRAADDMVVNLVKARREQRDSEQV
jgi:hypothetical protein